MKLRAGECLQCGKCCITYYIYGSMPIWEKIWARYQLWKAGKVLNRENSKCSHLHFRRGTSICLHYDKRPDFCRKYPDTTRLIKGCGYKWVNVKESKGGKHGI
jgi:Fe-S-cluster containining protein